MDALNKNALRNAMAALVALLHLATTLAERGDSEASARFDEAEELAHSIQPHEYQIWALLHLVRALAQIEYFDTANNQWCGY